MNCDQAIPLLEALADSQLMGEEGAAIAAHVERCAACAERVASVRLLKRRLKEAVLEELPPLGLETRLRARLRESQSAGSSFRLSFAIAALTMTVLTLAGWILVWRPVQNKVLAVLKAGAGHHVHCTIERTEPPLGGLMRPIDPEYRDLLERVARSIPGGYELRERHFCRHDGKRFQHIVYEKEGHRVSVLVTPRTNTGDFPALGALAAKMRASGIALYAADVRGVSTAGFTSGQNVAFVVSDLSEDENLRLLASLAENIRDVM